MDDVIMDRRTEEAPAQDARLKVRKKKKKRVNSSFLNYLFNLFACCLITVSFLGMDFVLLPLQDRLTSSAAAVCGRKSSIF